MTPEFDFTHPSADVATARLALARLQAHLDLTLDPLAETTIATDLAFAVLTLEDIYPPYPPIADELTPSVDPRADFALAMNALFAASAAATSARETLRFAYVIRDLRTLEEAPPFDSNLPTTGRSR